jgi:hypothetical protein
MGDEHAGNRGSELPQIAHAATNTNTNLASNLATIALIVAHNGSLPHD